MDKLVLFVQTVLVAMQTAWLFLGVLENLRAPAGNGQMVADVMLMKKMEEVYPNLFSVFGRNRIVDARAHKIAFAVIVFFECIVTVVMVTGTFALIGSLFDVVDPLHARVIAIFGVLGFTSIWSSFLVGGQWFHYWAGYENAQMTHFVMSIWGIVVLIFLFSFK